MQQYNYKEGFDKLNRPPNKNGVMVGGFAHDDTHIRH